MVTYPIEWITCDGCGLDWPVGVNVSPNVERETRCPRCLCAMIANLQRELGKVTVSLLGIPIDF